MSVKIPDTIPRNREGQYCFACFSPSVKRVFRDNFTYYQCSACNGLLERSLVVDNAITWWVDGENNYWHESVGVLVLVKNKLLTQLRRIYPFAYAIPAGHLDKDELPENAARRELREETGITASSLEVLKRDFDIAGDSCRRGSDHHRWHLYRVRMSAYPAVRLSDEASQTKWMTLQELKSESQLTHPLRLFVDTMGETLFQ